MEMMKDIKPSKIDVSLIENLDTSAAMLQKLINYCIDELERLAHANNDPVAHIYGQRLNKKAHEFQCAADKLIHLKHILTSN